MVSRNERFSILNAVGTAVAMSLIQPYVGILAVKLGASDLQLGYLSSWPNFVSVVAVLGAAAAVARSENKQRLIGALFLFGRAAALGAAAVPYFPPEYRVWALIGFWVLGVFPTAAGGNALQAFLADVFPATERARAFASRQSWAGAAGMVAVLVSGWLLDNLFPEPLGYQIMFSLSFVVALAEVFFFLQLGEPRVAAACETGPTPQPPRMGLRTFGKALSYGPFARFMLCSLLFHFTWQMAWPLFTSFQVKDLGANNFWLSMLTVANSLVMVLSYPWWARQIEKLGHKRMMTQAALHLALAPWLTSLAPSIEWLIVVNLFTGIGVAGVSLVVLNYLLDVSPSEGRPIYMAVHTALVTLSGALAPLVGAFLMTALPMRDALLLCTALRLTTGLTFPLLHYWERRQKGKGTRTENASTR